ncbi:MAG: RNA polymerase sigma factor [Dehalococcoidia bacterium]
MRAVQSTPQTGNPFPFSGVVLGRGGWPLDESGLIERARSGDATAYEEIVRRHQEIAFRTAFVITGAVAEAEDAVQEAFVKAYFALSRFRAGAPFRPWLLRIVANEARNRRTAAGRRAGLALRAADARLQGADAASPEMLALATEQRAELLAAVNRLRAEERLAVTARYFLQLSEEEIAAVMGCARGTVKSRLSRALRRLRVMLDGNSISETEVSRG